MEIAGKHKLFVIEDAAHALGAEYRGRKCGTFGDIGCFSFFANKNMTTAEGGMVVTNNDRLAEKIRLFRSHCMTTSTWDRYKGHALAYDVVGLGYNYRIDDIRSAIGLVQLEKLEKNNARRKIVSQKYIKLLQNTPGISIPFERYSGSPSFHIFPILLNASIDRRKFMEQMQKKGIQTSIHYPPIHLFKYYREMFGYKKGMLPETEEICRREVTLPLYQNLQSAEIVYIAECIKKIIKNAFF
jgi:dTDP-4-amino-4,6-dideoxygalactose transaminase